MARILLTGGSGGLGQAIQAQHVGGAELICPPRLELDFTRPDSLFDCLEAYQPDIIINAAAFTHVDRAEEQPEIAYRVNAKAPAVLAAWCDQHQARLFHLSTDYVFDSISADPIAEDAIPNPVNVYGASKAAGEQAIMDTCPDAIILRTSWLYGDAKKCGFVDKILAAAVANRPLQVVNDEFGCPVPVAWLAQIIWKILTLKDFPAGIWHAATNGGTCRYDLAKEALQLSRDRAWISQYRLEAASAEAYASIARRPKFAILDSSKLACQLGTSFPDWKDALEQYLPGVKGSLK